MKKGQEPFEIETLKHIRNRLDYIYSISKRYSHDQPELMDTVASLASIAKMFANVKMEELKGSVETEGSQGYIVRNLGNAFSRMQDYEKQQDPKFPDWKL
ncbi:hypothetical protein [Bacillus tuaregi]|uniref:hypothetical protein n=1 Tax=Bacillus tuaregi TaxID=1816695 RepID=UPI0008F82E35|nr:hypothetical protein [Bacillus tuaregi]